MKDRIDRVAAQVNHESSDEFKARTVFPAVAEELKKIHTSEGLRVLHIGEGSGQIARFVSDVGIKEAILVDKIGEILEVASENFNSHGIQNRTIQQDATHLLPIEPGSLDAAVALFSLNQIKHPEIVFDLVCSYLRPGGRFIVCVPDEAFINRLGGTKSKLDTEILGVLDRVQSGFLFRRQGMKVAFYSRPNSDYLDFMNSAGFISVESQRLEDKSDKDLVKTPKAILIVGRKMPVKLGDDKDNEVLISSDTVFNASPVALESQIEHEYLRLDLQREDGIYSIPLPKSDLAKKFLRLTFARKRPNLLIREVRMKSSKGVTKHAYRIFNKGKRIAYYSISVAQS